MDFILRERATSDELPPWAGIIFKYPVRANVYCRFNIQFWTNSPVRFQVDSDQLSEKLRAAYPDYKTLRERKHQAAIDFLREELSRMQSGIPIADASPVESFKSLTQEPLVDASNTAVEMVSDGDEFPNSSVSPPLDESLNFPKVLGRASRVSRASGGPEQSQSSALPKSAQQFVWSAHDGRSMQPKTKRKMTVEERSAYKETRKRGACHRCRRKKGRVIVSPTTFVDTTFLTRLSALIITKRLINEQAQRSSSMNTRQTFITKAAARTILDVSKPIAAARRQLSPRSDQSPITERSMNQKQSTYFL